MYVDTYSWEYATRSTEYKICLRYFFISPTATEGMLGVASESISSTILQLFGSEFERRGLPGDSTRTKSKV